MTELYHDHRQPRSSQYSMKCWLTVVCIRNGFAEIPRMAIETTSIFKHSTHKSQLTEHAMFSLTWCRDMRLGKMPDRQCIMHELDERICITVAYMRLKPTEGRPIVEPEKNEKVIENMMVATDFDYTLEVKVLNAEFGILDFDTAIMSWNLISFLFVNRRVRRCLTD